MFTWPCLTFAWLFLGIVSHARALEMNSHSFFFLFPTGELPLSCRHLNSAISATIHELYIHLDNATRFCAIVEGKQFKRDEHNGLNELVEFVGKCILEEIFQWIECKEVENLSFKDINVDQLSDVLGNYANDFFLGLRVTQ